MFKNYRIIKISRRRLQLRFLQMKQLQTLTPCIFFLISRIWSIILNILLQTDNGFLIIIMTNPCPTISFWEKSFFDHHVIELITSINVISNLINFYHKSTLMMSSETSLISVAIEMTKVHFNLSTSSLITTFISFSSPDPR